MEHSAGQRPPTGARALHPSVWGRKPTSPLAKGKLEAIAISPRTVAPGERPKRRNKAEAATSLAATGKEPEYILRWKKQISRGRVHVSVNGVEEKVEVNAEKGPVLVQRDGTKLFHDLDANFAKMCSADQKVLVYRTAKANLQTLEEALIAQRHAEAQASEEAEKRRRDEAHAQEERRMAAEKAFTQSLKDKVKEQLSDATVEQKVARRCCCELLKERIDWRWIMMEEVVENWQRQAVGLIYGLVFPWNEEMLIEFGAAWLTKAFHAAGTMDTNNRVVEIIPEAKVRVTAGNNAGKFLFEVRYAQKTDDLHERLFAKIPFPLEGPTYADRLSSSVYKQPMDFYEINTYRFLEDAIPVKTPKFYYGDISNETSNFILITERVDFSEIHGRREQIKPLRIEGPYEKCKDYQLRGSEMEYYMLLIQVHARIAGADKMGLMGPTEYLAGRVGGLRAGIADPQSWGCDSTTATGGDPIMNMNKLLAAIKFFTETGKVLFQSYVTKQAFIDKFKKTMMTALAYSCEIAYWKHADFNYVALGHQNLNMDNAFFWRTETNELDCGIFDFGGFGLNNLPHRVWWGLNCAEFENIQANLHAYIDAFIEMYQEFGGPTTDHRIFRIGMLLTAIDNLYFMVQAVPNCLRMCPGKEWATIEGRHDPRIAEDIGGKSTLRTTMRVMDNGLRILEELQADEVVDHWITDVFCGEWGEVAKSPQIVMGKYG